MALNTNNDPMGLAIVDYYRNKKAEILVVNSSITEDEEIPVEYLFREFGEMPTIEQKALELCKGKILDVGAAAGCHSLYLKKNKFDVTAIDFSELSVEVMRAQGLNKVDCIDFFKYNNEKFDTILFLMNGTGIAGDLKGLDALLQKCKSLLLAKGQILIDSSDIIYMFEGEEDYLNELEGYYGELEYQMKYKDIEGEYFNWLFIDFNLLSKKAEVAGFKCELVVEGEYYNYLAKLQLK